MANESILIVDDNILNLRLAEFLLADRGFKVHTVINANEAIKYLETAHPQLILMDIQLPGIDGLALTKILKSNPKHQTIPIIAITAYAMRGDEEKVMAGGCDGYIAKPINADTFADTVAGYLPNEHKE